MDLGRVRKVFVRAPNWVGDFVMATGAFERLRLGFPDARIVLGARPHLLDLLSGTSWYDVHLPTPRARGPAGLFAQVRALRRERCELAVVLPNSLETGLVPFLAGVPWRLGYRQGRPGLMNRGLRATGNRRLLSRHGPRRVPDPMPTYYANLIDLLGIPPGPSETVLRVTDDERERIAAWLAERGIDDGRGIVLLTAGASYGASKLWDADRFVALAKWLQARGDLVPVFLAGPLEVDMAERLATAAGASVATRPVLPLGMLKALVERSVLMVTTDTGPRHVAVALGLPVVCLIGPNDPRYTNYSLERTWLIRKDLPCMPCQRKICPLGHNDCMRTITVEEVCEAVQCALASRV